jgi:hypothetical protein
MTDAKISVGAETPPEDAPAAVPVMPASVVQDNYARVKASAANTLVRVNPDGIVHRGIGMIDTLRSDRGKGTTESLDMLRKEGAVKVEGLLSKTRDASGRFVKSTSR